jgi:hypothetical protein
LKPLLKVLGDLLVKAGAEIGAEALEKLLESKFGPLLKKLKDEKLERFEAVVAAINLLFAELKPLVEGTATSIDDAILDALQDAVNDVLAEDEPVQTNDEGEGEPTDPDEHHGNDGKP